MSENEKRQLENGSAVPIPLLRMKQEATLQQAFMEHEAKRSSGERRGAIIAFIFAALSFMVSLSPASAHVFEKFRLLLVVPLGLLVAGLLYLWIVERSSVARYRAFFGDRSGPPSEAGKAPAVEGK